MNPDPASPNRLNWRVILEEPVRQLAPWLAMVLLATWAGYPGVVCVSPMAWLIALRVGLLVAQRSASAQPGQRKREAALAGAWFGLLVGVLFWVFSQRLGPLQPGEETSAAVVTALVLGVGMLSGAGLAWFTAAQVERRREK